MEQSTVRPRGTAVLVVRRASSACHGAPLDITGDGGEPVFTCRECQQVTERVLGDPEEVEGHG